jgi:hypothetical protein
MQTIAENGPDRQAVPESYRANDAESRGQISSFRPGTRPPEDSKRCEGRKSRPLFAPADSSWRARAESHYGNILALLRARGPAGILSSELYDCPEKFGRSPRNRVSELRRDGFSIQTVHVNASTVRYVLLADHGERPATAPRDWYEKQTGKPRAGAVPDKSAIGDLPLFAGLG